MTHLLEENLMDKQPSWLILERWYDSYIKANFVLNFYVSLRVCTEAVQLLKIELVDLSDYKNKRQSA